MELGKINVEDFSSEIYKYIYIKGTCFFITKFVYVLLSMPTFSQRPENVAGFVRFKLCQIQPQTATIVVQGEIAHYNEMTGYDFVFTIRKENGMDEVLNLKLGLTLDFECSFE